MTPDDETNLRDPRGEYDPRGFRWAIVVSVVFWVGFILLAVRCSP
jgi:hypothetical protein